MSTAPVRPKELSDSELDLVGGGASYCVPGTIMITTPNGNVVDLPINAKSVAGQSLLAHNPLASQCGDS